MYMKQPYL